jgi:hypothetical protein
MLDCEILAGAADAGHHLIGDQENAVAAADFGDALDVTFGGRDRAEGGSG